MSDFRLSESNETEEEFRSSYRQIRETSCRCCSGMGDEDWCENVCHFLIAGDPEATTDGYPTVFGLDCDVAILCWGGDIDDVTPEVYCEDCARIRARREYEVRRKAEIQYQEQAATAKHQRAEEERKKRTVRDFWISLSHLEFELQCAKLFRGLGFNAETTGRTNDGGIDILLVKDGKRGAVQCKAWAQPCGVAELRDFYGALKASESSSVSA